MLPKIQYTIFDLEVPSLKKTFTFRPFLVKEEKILLTAQQSGDIKEMILALKQIINNCYADPTQEFEESLLSLLDIEWLFLKLRAKSVNNIVEITITDAEDGTQHKVGVNLDEVKIVYNPDHKDIVVINEDISLKLRYPNVDLLDKIQQMSFNVDMFFDVIKYCIEEIQVKGEPKPIYLKDYTDEQVKEFIDQINVAGFNEIQEFFITQPKMWHEIKYKNGKGEERSIVLETLADFFILG